MWLTVLTSTWLLLPAGSQATIWENHYKTLNISSTDVQRVYPWGGGKKRQRRGRFRIQFPNIQTLRSKTANATVTKSPWRRQALWWKANEQESSPHRHGLSVGKQNRIPHLHPPCMCMCVFVCMYTFTFRYVEMAGKGQPQGALHFDLSQDLYLRPGPPQSG